MFDVGFESTEYAQANITMIETVVRAVIVRGRTGAANTEKNEICHPSKY